MKPAPHAPVEFAELGAHRLGVPLLRARLMEEASRGHTPAPETVAEAWAAFCQKNQVNPDTGAPVPKEFMGCPPEGLKEGLERELRIQLWKEATFGPAAQDRFAERKPGLDRVVYSLLRVKEGGVARELYFRLREKEATFAELAPRYASGNEIYTGGIVGPVPFGAMHPGLAQALRGAVVGELLKPFSVAEWFLVARVDHHLPAEFDENIRALMIEELLHIWLDAQTHA